MSVNRPLFWPKPSKDTHGDAGEARNIAAHQQKKISTEAIIRVRDRYGLPIADDKIGERLFTNRPPMHRI